MIRPAVEVLIGRTLANAGEVEWKLKDEQDRGDYLESTGTQVNGQRVKGRTPLIGRNIVRIGSKEFVITNDKDNLI